MWDRSRDTDILLFLLSWISLEMQGSGHCTETLARLFLGFPSSALSFLAACLQSIFLSHFLSPNCICSPLFIHFYLESGKQWPYVTHSALSSSWPWKWGTLRAVTVFGTGLLWIVGAKASAGIHPAWRLQCRVQELTERGVITWNARPLSLGENEGKNNSLNHKTVHRVDGRTYWWFLNCNSVLTMFR